MSSLATKAPAVLRLWIWSSWSAPMGYSWKSVCSMARAEIAVSPIIVRLKLSRRSSICSQRVHLCFPKKWQIFHKPCIWAVVQLLGVLVSLRCGMTGNLQIRIQRIAIYFFEPQGYEGILRPPPPSGTKVWGKNLSRQIRDSNSGFQIQSLT
jgi:hypothetical protein